MTREGFLDLVTQYCKAEANPAYKVVPTPATELGDFVSDAIREFCGYAFALFNDDVALTIPASRVIDLRGDNLAQEVVWPVSVTLGGEELRNFEDKVGPCLVREVQSSRSGTAGVAKRWAFRLPQHLIFERSLSGVTGSSSVAGFVMHDPLVADEDLVTLPDEWIRPAVIWTAGRLIEPEASGTSLDKMRVLDPKAAELAIYLARLAVAEWPMAKPPILMEVQGAAA